MTHYILGKNDLIKNLRELLQSHPSNTRVYFHNKNNTFSLLKYLVKLRCREVLIPWVTLVSLDTSDWAQKFVRESEQRNPGLGQAGTALREWRRGHSLFNIPLLQLNSVLGHGGGSGCDGGNLCNSKKETDAKSSSPPPPTCLGFCVGRCFCASEPFLLLSLYRNALPSSLKSNLPLPTRLSQMLPAPQPQILPFLPTWGYNCL